MNPALAKTRKEARIKIKIAIKLKIFRLAGNTSYCPPHANLPKGKPKPNNNWNTPIPAKTVVARIAENLVIFIENKLKRSYLKITQTCAKATI